MTFPRRLAALLAIALVASAACGPAPVVTAPPSSASAAPSPTQTAAPSDIAFAPAAWPAAGSACSPAGGPTVRIGRISAPDAKTVVFTLCAPDSGFLARLAHPAMGIVDAASLARIAADPARSARDVAGHGAYAVVRWGGSNIELARVGGASAAAGASTVILRWDPDAAARTAALVAASVDGIDGPTQSGLDAAATNPALTVVTRASLATAVLGFGAGPGLSDARVRQAIAMGIDRDALAAAAFPAGSVGADHLVPCAVPSGCAGDPFAAFNAPAATAALQAAKFDTTKPLTLTVPDAAIPGLPDPAAAAAALRDQLSSNLGITAQIAPLPADQFRAAVDGGTVSGLYLDGVAAAVPDPSAFLGALFVDRPSSLAAQRATGVAAALANVASTADAAQRNAAFAALNKSLRTTVPVAPLVHPGSDAVFRSDVQGLATSPLGLDPLGAMTAGDRGQVVFLQAAAPAGGWCGDQPSIDAYRLCNLVTDGLYGFTAATLNPAPRLATSCTPNGDASVWTCRLRAATTPDGLTLDAADVVATFRAMADPTDPVHVAVGDAAFAAWAAVFGSASGSLPPVPTPSPAPTASAPASTPSGSPGASASAPTGSARASASPGGSGAVPSGSARASASAAP